VPTRKKPPKPRAPRARRPVAPPDVSAPERWPYVERTRHPGINLLFLAPWLLVYLLCWWLVGDGVETSAAESLRRGLRLLGARGLFVLTLCVSLGLCAFLLVRLRAATADAAVFPGMILEGLLFGWILGFAAEVLTRVLPVGHWIGLLRPAAVVGDLRDLGMAIGAGIFEELVFRGVLCFGLYRVLRHVAGTDGWTAGTAAVVVSAAVFSAYHHWGVGGEPWDATRFAFRFHAGALLGTVFLTRGLGIAAFAHGFYDALVLLGR
jgi:membrane protease YdiL (CAAX protease family)